MNLCWVKLARAVFFLKFQILVVPNLLKFRPKLNYLKIQPQTEYYELRAVGCGLWAVC